MVGDIDTGGVVDRTVLMRPHVRASYCGLSGEAQVAPSPTLLQAQLAAVDTDGVLARSPTVHGFLLST